MSFTLVNKIKNPNLKLGLLLISLFSSYSSTHAAIRFGDTKAQSGELAISGAIRAKYVYNFDTTPSDSKFSFSDAIIWLDYNSPQWIGHLDYRFYEYYGHLGDASWLTDAWFGYKIDQNSKIIAGLNPVPFGLGRFWGNTFYLGIANAAGLEDVHDLGIKYDFNNGTNEFQLAYYPTDGGNFYGHSKDSKRFSVNLVNADDYVKDGTNTREKNAIVVRGAHTFKNINNDEKISSQLGASAWYSQVENKRSEQTGSRQVYAIFANNTYHQWNVQALAGYQNIDNADHQFPNQITLGGFDGSFNSATKGQIYSAEVSYSFPNKVGPFTGVRPYLNYSTYIKDEDGFKNSTRFIPGLAFSYEKLTVQAELLIGKHDPYVGDSEGLAAGGTNGDWFKRAYVSLAYYF
ncbi:hypothetical protein [Acinetobacter gerneri]|jgi:hypothetical protein|uniref:hypothetical protein n=1 Tax=Acinetobacter gerneri TaxID=202952 RepID=UPI0023F4A5E6|nr:hypothetical protein [Acinetobacter gerneri]MCH4245156.1 hypothetical protein [Acinetobacter gerneri]